MNALVELAFLWGALGMAWYTRRLTVRLMLPWVAAIVVPAYLVYLAALLCGLSGHLSLVPVALLLAGLSAAAAALLRRAAPRDTPSASPARMPPSRGAAALASAFCALVVVLAVRPDWPLSLFPGIKVLSLWDFLAHGVIRTLGGERVELAWDVTSYNIPALIEFLQNRTLWSFEGPYQSYSFGFELITGLSPALGDGILTILLGGPLSLLLLALAGTAIVSGLTDPRIGERLGPPYGVARAVLVAIIALTLFRSSFEQVGKPDMFAAGAVLASLALLVPLLAPLPARRPAVGAALIASACALALACASKPNNLAFVPIWLATAAFSFRVAAPGRRAGTGWVAFAGSALIVATGAGFALRNVAAFGTPLGDLAFDVWPTTIAAALQSGDLMRSLRPVDAAVLLAWFAAAVGLPLASLWVRDRCRIAVLVLAGWSIAGIAILAVTPLSFAGGMVHWRFAVVPLMLAGVGGVVLSHRLLGRWLDRLERRPRWSAPLHLPSWVPAPGEAAGCLALPGGAVLAAGLVVGHHAAGVPTPAQVIPDRYAAVYAWVREQPEALRIYAVNLRPYGLYGWHYRNRVFYDLNSGRLDSAESGRQRLNAIRRRFAPDLILIADPANGPDGSLKPVTDWLSRQPCVAAAFAAASVAGFRVDRRCATAWDGGEQPDPLRMEP